jgi:hypothetical protein
MNLARHIQVLWRFRAVMATGLLLGLVLAFLAAYKVPSMERRGTETWTAASDIFVTQPGFPWGRVTLPSVPTNPLDTETDKTREADTPFADPARFSTLALLYSNLAMSDVVRAMLPEHPTPGQISTRVLDATGNAAFLPIITLTTKADTAEGAVKLNSHLIQGLTRYLEQEQRDSNTPANERVQLSTLNAPKGATLVAGRSMTLPLLALMLCLLAAVAVVHILENLRPRDRSQGDILVDDDLLISDLAGSRMAADGEYEPPTAARNGHGATYAAPPPAGDR